MAVDEQNAFIHLWVYVLSRLRPTKNILCEPKEYGTICHENVHTVSLSSVLVRRGREVCSYQCSLCQKTEYRWREQEGSGCQSPGEEALTSQLPLSVILSSQWCIDVIRHQSPSRTSQYNHAEKGYSRTIGDCDPCYGMTKIQEGGGERGAGSFGGRGAVWVWCVYVGGVGLFLSIPHSQHS